MIKTLKKISIGVVIGLLVGLWFGVNIGKHRHLLSNPFEDKPLHRELMDRGGGLLEKSGRALRNQVDTP